ncbi:hypothetical protein SFMTTN_2143 [Sulfuriferula multivorans]|uniref:Uncharacterized protein n=1 Tax=Sulfuriferula multivorans TaxID=1559896 RepID=A0A401JFD0_9PROT|nr:hypothetical protein SFMTTN_2143 [Sulfuriferula multivorans]
MGIRDRSQFIIHAATNHFASSAMRLRKLRIFILHFPIPSSV